MNPQEEIKHLSNQVSVVHKMVNEVKEEVATLSNDVRELYTALIGNKLGQRGLVERVSSLETKQKFFDTVYYKAVGASLVVATVCTVLVSLIKHKFGL